MVIIMMLMMMMMIMMMLICLTCRTVSGGPLPEELLSIVQCPVSMLWGQNDPWEPIDTGKVIGYLDI